jgi:pyruvate dehydrogenase E1 component alpha subunit
MSGKGKGAAEALGGLEKKELHDLLRSMLLIRRFEEKSAEMYALGKIGGFLHLYIGQEAVAVGAISTLRPDDCVISTYREHGHCLAKGSDPRRVMAELFGRADGLSKGKGGSMHLFDRERNFLGGHAIVGGHIPIGTGAAFAINYEGGDQVVLVFFGEGALQQGVFYESINMASLWKLPVIYVCENNRYAMGTSLERTTVGTELHRRGHPFGMLGESVDGMDVLAVREVVGRAVERARREKVPTFIEARTYRFRGHSMRDPAGAVYRTKAEVQEERKRDPITILQDRLTEAGQLGEGEWKAMEREVAAIVQESVEYADASPPPPLEWLLTDVYAD